MVDSTSYEGGFHDPAQKVMVEHIDEPMTPDRVGAKFVQNDGLTSYTNLRSSMCVSKMWSMLNSQTERARTPNRVAAAEDDTRKVTP